MLATVLTLLGVMLSLASRTCSSTENLATTQGPIVLRMAERRVTLATRSRGAPLGPRASCPQGRGLVGEVGDGHSTGLASRCSV